jgi:hydrogenase expression/formation protein HypC
MQIKNKRLFFCYALPCAQTFVKRKQLKQEELDKIIYDFSKDKMPENGFENTFKVAMSMLKILALKLGKDEIDEYVMRQYYLVEHDKIVDRRYEEMGDFDPTACKIRIGEVLDINGNKAKVKTDLGAKDYRTDFVKNLKIGDWVIVHYDFIVEKFTEKIKKDLLKMKPIL